MEDSAGKFRFDYSVEFLRWALNPPTTPAGEYSDWIVAVKATGTDKFFAFITAIPVHMVVNGAEILMAEVNFLCVHKKIREKRLAPLLIREITRRVNLKNIWQAIYTSGATLPTPFSTAQYWHRNLNPEKLVKAKFAFRPAGMNNVKYNKMHRLPTETTTPGLRQMKVSDVPKVTVALNKHLQTKYAVHIKFDQAEVKHFLLPQAGIVNSFVVETEGEITDFYSFYTLNSSILQEDLKIPSKEEKKSSGAAGQTEEDKQEERDRSRVNAAYAFYNFVQGDDPERLQMILKDMLTLAKQEKFDVFNMTEVLQNFSIGENLLFKPGDGKLAHYLYNYRVKQVTSDKIGIVLV